MTYLPNSVYIEEKGVFNIVSGPKNTLFPVIGMAVSGPLGKSVYLTDKNTILFEKIRELHGSLSLLQWNFQDEILPILSDSTTPMAIIEYNRYITGKNKNQIEELGKGLQSLAKKTNATYLMISTFIDDNLRMLCEYADRVLLVEDKNNDSEMDFVFKDKATGCYVRRQKTINDFL